MWLIWLLLFSVMVLDCVAGKYSSAGASSCTDCVSGKSSTATGTSATAESVCKGLHFLWTLSLITSCSLTVTPTPTNTLFFPNSQPKYCSKCFFCVYVCVCVRLLVGFLVYVSSCWLNFFCFFLRMWTKKKKLHTEKP